MAVKTITIDMEAYDVLSRHKRADQSFSQVIKEHFGRQLTVGRFLQRVRDMRGRGVKGLADGIEEAVRDRKLDRRRIEPL